MNMSKTHEMGQRMFEEARADVTHADQKASVLLAALGIGFGAVLGGQLSAGWDSSPVRPARDLPGSDISAVTRPGCRHHPIILIPATRWIRTRHGPEDDRAPVGDALIYVDES